MHPLAHALRGASYTLGVSALIVTRVATGSRDAFVREATKRWADGMCSRLGLEVRAEGVGEIDWSKSHVVMANHQSYLDIVALCRALPVPLAMVAKRELFRVPVFGEAMRALGCVSIDRRGGPEAHRALAEAAERVRTGSGLVVFPEGTRSAGDRIGPLKKGPFYLVQAARAPIVPIGIRGTAALMPRSGFGIRPGTVELRVGAVIPVEGEGGAEERARLADQVRRALAELTGLALSDGRRSGDASGAGPMCAGLPDTRAS